MGITEAVPKPAGRSRREVVADLLSRLADPRPSKEDRVLLDHVNERVKAIPGADPKLQRSRLDFVEHCYGQRLANYRRARSKWRTTAFTGGLAVALLGAASAVAGALGKGVTAGSGWSVAAIATGSAVGVVAAVNRALQPEESYVQFAAAGRALRGEGWDYVQGLGRYGGDLDENACYALFAGEARKIMHAREQSARRMTPAN